MLHGQNEGDSAEALTLNSASEQLEGLLDDDGYIADEEQTPASRTPKKASESDEPEDEADDEEPEAPREDDEEDEPVVDDEEHDESDEAEDEPEEQPEQPKHKVKVDGQELEVTLDELKNGYSRTQDYTRKTQKHAEQVKAFEAEATAVRAERQQYHGALTEVENQLKALGSEPDWDKLAAEHPEQLAQIHAAWQVHKGKLDKIAAEKAKVETQMHADAETAYNAHLTKESTKLIDALPEWKEEAKYKAGMTELQDYARSIGFSDAELNGITDHRAVLMLRKAMMFDRATKQKAQAEVTAKAKISKVKTATPGTPAAKGSRAVTERTRRVQRLAKTHTQQDAAAILELSL